MMDTTRKSATISIEQLKIVLDKLERTIFEQGTTRVTIPLFDNDLTNLNYDNETVQCTYLYFELIDNVWHIML